MYMIGGGLQMAVDRQMLIVAQAELLDQATPASNISQYNVGLICKEN
jgi:hypothetical protein